MSSLLLYGHGQRLADARDRIRWWCTPYTLVEDVGIEWPELMYEFGDELPLRLDVLRTREEEHRKFFSIVLECTY